MNNFINNRRFFLSIILLSSLCGTLYAIFIKDNTSLLYAINSFFDSSTYNISTLNVFRQAMITYLISLTLVFTGASSKNLLPLAVISFFYMIFSYSFTFTCFVILYGIRGVLVAILLIGVSSIGILASLLEIFYQGTLYSIFGTITFKKYFDIYIKAILVVFGIALYDAMVILNIQNIISFIIFG
ncbi:hypothetical protein AN641_06865 [Candidatus Epulonipiscioides gigas]|nr:hypothetical protein AN641_06865 [Epulopiscium sp. SCG-C07WGA-EpuloA2]